MTNYKFNIGEQVIFTYLAYVSMYTRECKTGVGTIVSRRKKFFGLFSEYAIDTSVGIHVAAEDDIWKYGGETND